MELEYYLQKYFHYNMFRNGQKEIILELLNKKDIIVMLPTGSGKSIIFQLAGLLLNKITLVITPLIALMKDQVDHLNNLNIKATYIASTKTNLEIEDIYNKINEYKFIYITPERFSNSKFLSILNNIGLVVIDEAHTILWGKEFREEFLNIGKNILKLKPKPIVCAFSATLSKKDLMFVKEILMLDKCNIYFKLPLKNNLSYYIIETDFLKSLKKILDYYKNEKIIIYTVTIKNMYYLYNYLKDDYKTSIYCGNLDKQTKEKNQNDFYYDKTNIMIATNAYGMGIDIKNIRVVVHYDIPLTINDYIQQSGRAGRDLKKSYVFTFINKDKIKEGLNFIYSNNKNKEKVNEFNKVIKLIYSKNKEKIVKKYYKM